ncbi:hypothetical protein GYMLUDRAFT_59741 [Collybiopsis luxurians FD-317 M1]|uniref:Autophagy-related protein 13 n=1 Tax=Collybiopsis luxurians FD-317 M1 TaxID=944289 RepID=A0A0D0CMY7_9AGAR|nr:hypothetical protein GYMLUDRAFT_59741 [Collybiopsis luxurians FD-317 M1]
MRVETSVDLPTTHAWGSRSRESLSQNSRIHELERFLHSRLTSLNTPTRPPSEPNSSTSSHRPSPSSLNSRIPRMADTSISPAHTRFTSISPAHTRITSISSAHARFLDSLVGRLRRESSSLRSTTGAGAGASAPSSAPYPFLLHSSSSKSTDQLLHLNLPTGKPGSEITLVNVNPFKSSTLAAATPSPFPLPSNLSLEGASIKTVRTGSDTADVAGETDAAPGRTRYSSPFEHRYASKASTRGGDVERSSKNGRYFGFVSGGGEEIDGRLVTLVSSAAELDNMGALVPSRIDYISHHHPVDHDDRADLNSFMQDIDTRKPLLGRSRAYAEALLSSERNSNKTAVDTNMDTNPDAQWTTKGSREKLSTDRLENLDFATEPSTESLSKSLRESLGSSPSSSGQRSFIGGPFPSVCDGTLLTVEDDVEDDAIADADPSRPLTADTSPSATTTTVVASSPSTGSLHPSSSPSSSRSILEPSQGRITSADSTAATAIPTHSDSSLILTSALDVEVRLKEMHDVFFASLEGLKVGRGGRGDLQRQR